MQKAIIMAISAKQLFRVIAAIVTVQIGFGCYGVLLKKFNNDNPFNPVVFSFYRDIGCFFVLFAGARLLEGHVKWPALRELPLFILMGVSGCWANQLFYLMGNFYTTADIASIWQPAIPVWTFILSVLFQVEAPPPLRKLHGAVKLLGVAFAIGGAVVMTLGKPTVSCAGLDESACTDGEHKHACQWDSSKTKCEATAEKSVLLGNMFLLINTLSTAVYIILQKRFVFAKEADRTGGGAEQMLGAYSWSERPLLVTAWSYLFGAITMILTCVIGYVGRIEMFEFRGSTDTFAIPLSTLLPLFYAIFVSSALCYGLITYANKYLDPSVVSAFWPLQVPIAVLLSLAVGLGSITSTQGLGAGLIFAGLLCISFSERRKWSLQKKEEQPLSEPLVQEKMI